MLQLDDRQHLGAITYKDGDRALTYSVRLMTREDIPQVAEIDHEAFSTQWPPTSYQHELQNQLARYVVACDDARTVKEPLIRPDTGVRKLISRIRHWLSRGRLSSIEPLPPRQYIVGFAGIWVMADEAHITNIAVRMQYQRRGLGELLLISTIDMARELKATVMTLEVRASNTTAQNLYRKYGFIQVGLRRAYYTDNREDGIIMSTEDINSDSFQACFQQLKQIHSQKIGDEKPVG